MDSVYTEKTEIKGKGHIHGLIFSRYFHSLLFVIFILWFMVSLSVASLIPKPVIEKYSKSLEWKVIVYEGTKIHYTSEDSEFMKRFKQYLSEGRQRVERFFGKDFLRPFIVRIFPDRASLDEHWRKAWNLPGFESSCWMVASGAGNELDLLSPRTWNEEACEHDPKDETEIQLLINHELVHIYHSQVNPSPEFESLEAIGWFMEGLATYASRQVDDERIQRAKEAVETGGFSKSLENMWSGPYRYAICGTLVQFIDTAYGRGTLIEMLSYATRDEFLNRLVLSEEELINAWKEFVIGIEKKGARPHFLPLFFLD